MALPAAKSLNPTATFHMEDVNFTEALPAGSRDGSTGRQGELSAIWAC